MDFHFESLAASFIDMGGFYDGESAAFSREGNWAGNGGASADGSIDDLLGGLIDNAMIVSFETNADLETFVLFCFCHSFNLSANS